MEELVSRTLRIRSCSPLRNRKTALFRKFLHLDSSSLFLEGNKYIDNDVTGVIESDQKKYSILAPERLTQFKFDRIFNTEEKDEEDSALNKHIIEES